MIKKILYKSVLTCPECSHQEQLVMPTDACQWFYECSNCLALLKPKQGDCCVFCSYGSIACTPIQLQETGGCCNAQ